MVANSTVRNTTSRTSIEDGTKEKERGKMWDYTASAMMSGIVTKSACAPLERIRLLYQVQGMFGTSPVDVVKYRSLSHTVKTILREEGVIGFWRGNGANMIRAAVVYAMKFGTNDIIKERMLKSKKRRIESENAGSRQAQITGLPTGSHTTAQLGIISLMQAGLLAGFLQKFASYPLDLVSVRIALGVNASSLSGKEKTYDSIWGTIKRIKATEGFTGFYKGFGPTLLTGAPYVSLQMTFFELYNRKLNSSLSLNDKKPKGWLNVFLTSSLAGSLAGITAQVIVFPGDTIRKRMMSNGVDGRKRLYTNSWDCMKQIYRKEGIRAFYYGVGPMALRAIPSGAIQFGVLIMPSRQEQDSSMIYTSHYYEHCHRCRNPMVLSTPFRPRNYPSSHYRLHKMRYKRRRHGSDSKRKPSLRSLPTKTTCDQSGQTATGLKPRNPNSFSCEDHHGCTSSQGDDETTRRRLQGSLENSVLNSCRQQRRGIRITHQHVTARSLFQSTTTERQSIAQLCSELLGRIERAIVAGDQKLDRVSLQMILYQLADLTLPELGATIEDEIEPDISSRYSNRQVYSNSNERMVRIMTSRTSSNTDHVNSGSYNTNSNRSNNNLSPHLESPILPTDTASSRSETNPNSPTAQLKRNRQILFASNGFLALCRLLWCPDECFAENLEVVASIRNDCLNLLKEYMTISTPFADSGIQTNDLVLRVVELLAIPATFGFAEALLEVMFSTHDFSVRIKQIPKFTKLLPLLSPRQLALSTRLISLTILVASVPSSCSRTLNELKENEKYVFPSTLYDIEERQRKRNRGIQQDFKTAKYAETPLPLLDEWFSPRGHVRRVRLKQRRVRFPNIPTFEMEAEESNKNKCECNLSAFSLPHDSLFHPNNCRWVSDQNHDLLIKTPGLLFRLISLLEFQSIPLPLSMVALTCEHLPSSTQLGIDAEDVVNINIVPFADPTEDLTEDDPRLSTAAGAELPPDEPRTVTQVSLYDRNTDRPQSPITSPETSSQNSFSQQHSPFMETRNTATQNHPIFFPLPPRLSLTPSSYIESLSSQPGFGAPHISSSSFVSHFLPQGFSSTVGYRTLHRAEELPSLLDELPLLVSDRSLWLENRPFSLPTSVEDQQRSHYRVFWVHEGNAVTSMINEAPRNQFHFFTRALLLPQFLFTTSFRRIFFDTSSLRQYPLEYVEPRTITARAIDTLFEFPNGVGRIFRILIDYFTPFFLSPIFSMRRLFRRFLMEPNGIMAPDSPTVGSVECETENAFERSKSPRAHLTTGSRSEEFSRQELFETAEQLPHLLKEEKTEFTSIRRDDSASSKEAPEKSSVTISSFPVPLSPLVEFELADHSESPLVSTHIQDSITMPFQPSFSTDGGITQPILNDSSAAPGYQFSTPSASAFETVQSVISLSDIPFNGVILLSTYDGRLFQLRQDQLLPFAISTLINIAFNINEDSNEDQRSSLMDMYRILCALLTDVSEQQLSTESLLKRPDNEDDINGMCLNISFRRLKQNFREVKTKHQKRLKVKYIMLKLKRRLLESALQLRSKILDCSKMSIVNGKKTISFLLCDLLSIRTMLGKIANLGKEELSAELEVQQLLRLCEDTIHRCQEVLLKSLDMSDNIKHKDNELLSSHSDKSFDCYCNECTDCCSGWSEYDTFDEYDSSEESDYDMCDNNDDIKEELEDPRYSSDRNSTASKCPIRLSGHLNEHQMQNRAAESQPCNGVLSSIHGLDGEGGNLMFGRERNVSFHHELTVSASPSILNSAVGDTSISEGINWGASVLLWPRQNNSLEVAATDWTFDGIESRLPEASRSMPNPRRQQTELLQPTFTLPVWFSDLVLEPTNSRNIRPLETTLQGWVQSATALSFVSRGPSSILSAPTSLGIDTDAQNQLQSRNVLQPLVYPGTNINDISTKDAAFFFECAQIAQQQAEIFFALIQLLDGPRMLYVLNQLIQLNLIPVLTRLFDTLIWFDSSSNYQVTLPMAELQRALLKSQIDTTQNQTELSTATLNEYDAMNLPKNTTGILNVFDKLVWNELDSSNHAVLAHSLALACETWSSTTNMVEKLLLDDLTIKRDEEEPTNRNAIFQVTPFNMIKNDDVTQNNISRTSSGSCISQHAVAKTPPTLCERTCCNSTLEFFRLLHFVTDFESPRISSALKHQLLSDREWKRLDRQGRVKYSLHYSPLIDRIVEPVSAYHLNPALSNSTRRFASTGGESLRNDEPTFISLEGGASLPPIASSTSLIGSRAFQRSISVANPQAISDSSVTQRKVKNIRRFTFLPHTGLLLKMLTIHAEETSSSFYKPALSSAIQSTLRGVDPAIQIFVTKAGLLEVSIRDILMKAPNSCDLLADVVKFNPYVLQRLNVILSDDKQTFDAFCSLLDQDLSASNVLIRSLVLTIEFCRQVLEAQISSSHWRFTRLEGEIAAPFWLRKKATLSNKNIRKRSKKKEDPLMLLPWRVFHFLDYLPARELGISNNSFLGDQIAFFRKFSAPNGAKHSSNDSDRSDYDSDSSTEEFGMGCRPQQTSLSFCSQPMSPSHTTFTANESCARLPSGILQESRPIWYGNPPGLTLPFRAGFSLGKLLDDSSYRIKTSSHVIETHSTINENVSDDGWEDESNPASQWKLKPPISPRGLRPLPDSLTLIDLPEKIQILARPLFRRKSINIDLQNLVHLKTFRSSVGFDLEPEFQPEEYKTWRSSQNSSDVSSFLTTSKTSQYEWEKQINYDSNVCSSFYDRRKHTKSDIYDWQTPLDNFIESKKLSITMRLICALLDDTLPEVLNILKWNLYHAEMMYEKELERVSRVRQKKQSLINQLVDMEPLQFRQNETHSSVLPHRYTSCTTPVGTSSSLKILIEASSPIHFTTHVNSSGMSSPKDERASSLDQVLPLQVHHTIEDNDLQSRDGIVVMKNKHHDTVDGNQNGMKDEDDNVGAEEGECELTEAMKAALPSFEHLSTSDQLGSFHLRTSQCFEIENRRLSSVIERDSECASDNTNFDRLSSMSRGSILTDPETHSLTLREHCNGNIESDKEMSSSKDQIYSDVLTNENKLQYESVQFTEQSLSVSSNAEIEVLMKTIGSEPLIPTEDESEEVDKVVRFLDPIFQCKEIPGDLKSRQGLTRSMYNFRALLHFWYRHYATEAKFSRELEFSCQIPLHYWEELVEILLGPETSVHSILHQPSFIK